MGENVITFYTIHCPKCKILQGLMETKNITFSIVDNEDEVKQVAEKNGTNFAPFAFIDGEFYDTKQLQNWIKEQ